MKNILAFIFTCCFVFIFANETHAKERVEIGTAIGEYDNQLIIVNKATNKLAFFDDGVLIREFPVATGKSATLTPEGDFNIIVKWECPIYYKTKNGPCEPGNPLGPRWIGFNVPGTEGYTYGVHGNNASWTIGTYASAGCVRMYNEDVIWLFDQITLGARVIVLNHPEPNMIQIAKEKGYVMKEGQPFKEKLTLLEETTLYEKPSDYSKTEETIQALSIYPTEHVSGWYKVKLEEKEYWIKPKNYYIGEEKEIEGYLPADKPYQLFREPDSASEKVGKTDGDLFFQKQLDHWYCVVAGENELGWVRLAEEKVLTKEEYETYKEEQKKGNIIKTIKELNPIKKEKVEEETVEEPSFLKKLFEWILSRFKDFRWMN